MLEAINSMTQVHGDLHYGTPSEPDLGQWYPKEITPGFHVYAIKWEPDRIRFYVDGQEYLTFTDQEWTTSVGSLPAPFDQPFHLMINVALGGNWPGPIATNTPFPQQLVVRWVRVYQRSSAYAWPIPGIIQADRTINRSSDVKLRITQDLTYDPQVTPTSPSNLSLVLDHKLLFTGDGDHAAYRVRVFATGSYTLSLRVKSGVALGIIHLDGKELAVLPLPKSLDWHTVSMRVHLPAGVHTLQLTFSKAAVQLHYLQLLEDG